MRKVIAEIGVNHNNSEEILTKLIEKSVLSGVDYVKFQRFIASDEIASTAALTNYQREAVEDNNQLEMAEKLEMDDELLEYGVNLCKKLGVKPMCSAFEIKSLRFMREVLGFTELKIPSPEITNIPYLKLAANLFRKVYLSTGASELWEVGYAISLMKTTNPELDIELMHCVSEYPAPINALNLSAIQTMKDAFQLEVGFSDHSLGYFGSIAALTLGASIIEKHVTLDKSMKGPDHKASSTFDEIEIIVEYAKSIDSMIGNGVKTVSYAEHKNKDLIRKSLYINAIDLKKGHRIQEDDIACKRPYIDSLLTPANYDSIIGKRLREDMCYDQGIKWQDIE